MKHVKKYLPNLIAIFGAVIFLDSLRYKFTDHPNTQVIFGKLNDWATSWGAAGLFGHTGLFSQYVIGTVELFASLFLLLGIFGVFRRFQVVGAMLAFLVMTGAVYFHLFTPLGTDPNNDGGGLFVAAVVLWIGTIVLMYFRKADLKALYKAKWEFLFPKS